MIPVGTSVNPGELRSGPKWEKMFILYPQPPTLTLESTQTPEKWPSLCSVEIFQNTITIAKHTLLPFWSQKRDCHSNFWRKFVDSLKTTLWSSFSLFPVKYSVRKLFLVLAHMQFPILDHYIHMSRHWKATIRTIWTFLCVCWYVCNDPELETAYKQAPKTSFRMNISLGKEKRNFIMFSF